MSAEPQEGDRVIVQLFGVDRLATVRGVDAHGMVKVQIDGQAGTRDYVPEAVRAAPPEFAVGDRVVYEAEGVVESADEREASWVLRVRFAGPEFVATFSVPKRSELQSGDRPTLRRVG